MVLPTVQLGYHRVLLHGDDINGNAKTKRIRNSKEKRRLIEKLGPPRD